MFPYRKILAQAWLLTKTYKFLWAFGLLLFLGQVFNAGYTILSQNQRLPDSIQNLMERTWVLWLLFVIVCVWLLVYFRARGGVILAIKSLIDREPVRPLAAFYTGRFFVTRLLGLMIALQLITFVFSLLIATPIFYLFTQGLVIRGLILAVLGLAVVVPVAFLIVYLNILGSLFIVIYNMPLRASLAGALNLIAAFWRRLLGLGLLVLGIRILVFITGLILSSPFVILARKEYYSGGSLLSFVLLVACGSIIFLAAGSLLTAFEQVVWVRLFGELIKPQKLEEPEAEVVAEPIVPTE